MSDFSLNQPMLKKRVSDLRINYYVRIQFNLIQLSFCCLLAWSRTILLHPVLLNSAFWETVPALFDRRSLGLVRESQSPQSPPTTHTRSNSPDYWLPPPVTSHQEHYINAFLPNSHCLVSNIPCWLTWPSYLLSTVSSFLLYPIPASLIWTCCIAPFPCHSSINQLLISLTLCVPYLSADSREGTIHFSYRSFILTYSSRRVSSSHKLYARALSEGFWVSFKLVQLHLFNAVIVQWIVGLHGHISCSCLAC